MFVETVDVDAAELAQFGLTFGQKTTALPMTQTGFFQEPRLFALAVSVLPTSHQSQHFTTTHPFLDLVRHLLSVLSKIAILFKDTTSLVHLFHLRRINPEPSNVTDGNNQSGC